MKVVPLSLCKETFVIDKKSWIHFPRAVLGLLIVGWLDVMLKWIRGKRS